MKIASLIFTGILMLLSGLGFLICMILPGLNSHVSIQEAMLVAIPLAILCFISFIGVVISSILLLRGRKRSMPSSG